MVKKWLVIMTIFIVLIVGCGLEYNYVNKSFLMLEKELQSYEKMLDVNKESIDTETNISYIENLHKKWHTKVEALKALIWHTGIKDIEVGLSRIATYTKENDYTEALAELLSLIDYVQHYASDFKLTIENLL